MQNIKEIRQKLLYNLDQIQNNENQYGGAIKTSKKISIKECEKRTTSVLNYLYLLYSNCENEKKHGGQNKIIYKLTEDAFELLKNSYNLRNRYIVDISDNVKHVNIGMCIETQTIGFIENTYSNMLNIKRQYAFGKYKVDLYFIDYKLVIECDENNHDDREPINEKVREEYIKSLGNKIIRYNPNTASFDLSNVLREINAVLFYKENLITAFLKPLY
jgi:very-short-patch-repair endonuclease